MNVGEMTWDQVARRLAAGDAAILPVGAGAKQHGWHMPMATDAIQAEWLAARLSEHAPALVWPVVTYGHYPAFVDYAGSCSLSAATFEAVVRELLDTLIAFGAHRVMVIDTGISTIMPIDRAIAATAAPARVRHLKVYEGSRFRAAADARRAGIGHADEIETSIMLALTPERIDMARTVAGPSGTSPGPLQHRDATAPNYSASGSTGDPAGATADRGKLLLEAMVEDMLHAIGT